MKLPAGCRVVPVEASSVFWRQMSWLEWGIGRELVEREIEQPAVQRAFLFFVIFSGRSASLTGGKSLAERIRRRVWTHTHAAPAPALGRRLGAGQEACRGLDVLALRCQEQEEGAGFWAQGMRGVVRVSIGRLALCTGGAV